MRAALYIITAAHWLSTDAHMEFKQYIKVQFLHFYQKQRSASSQWKQSSWILACVWVCCVLSSTMVQWQLCTPENLMYSGFGRPFPRHGLQLLFWFSNQCVTCEVVQLVVTMKVRSGLCVSVCVCVNQTNTWCVSTAGVGLSAGERELRLPPVWKHGGAPSCSEQAQEEQE